MEREDLINKSASGLVDQGFREIPDDKITSLFTGAVYRGLMALVAERNDQGVASGLYLSPDGLTLVIKDPKLEGEMGVVNTLVYELPSPIELGQG